VRDDIALLRTNVAKGWTTPQEFRAATRVFNFMAWEHTKGGLAGVGELLRNSSGTFDRVYRDLFGDPERREAPRQEPPRRLTG
jgi:hypothetical protein